MALAVISLLFFAPRGVFADVSFPITLPYVSGGHTYDGYFYSGTFIVFYADTIKYPASFLGDGTDWYPIGTNYLHTSSAWGGQVAVYTNPASAADGFYLSCTSIDSSGAHGCGSATTNTTMNLIIDGSFNSDRPVANSGGIIFTPTGWVPPPPPTTDITSISPQVTDPFTDTSTTTVSYSITPADLAAGSTTLSYVITSQDSIGNAIPQIGTIVATSSGSFTNTFVVNTSGLWSAYYTLSGVAGEDPNIGANFSIATSTVWIKGSSIYYAITSATSTGTTTNGLSLQQCKSTSLVDFSYFACVIGNRLSDVFQWLFLPPAGSLNEYQNFKTTVETKAPFGYFILIKNAISGINASSTSAFTLTLDQGVLAGIITPIRTALSWILLMGFGFWFYMRMKHLDIW